MNIEKQINSGIIESYVLGLCSEKETKELKELAKRYPKVLLEIHNTEQRLQMLFSTGIPDKSIETAKANLFDKLNSLKIKNIHTQTQPPFYRKAV